MKTDNMKKIYMKTADVLASAAGNKTSVRLPDNRLPYTTSIKVPVYGALTNDGKRVEIATGKYVHTRRNPFGPPGTELLVSESIRIGDWRDGTHEVGVQYRDSPDLVYHRLPKRLYTQNKDRYERKSSWFANRSMPPWAGRFKIIIETLHVERLWDICADDYEKEGAEIRGQEYRMPGQSCWDMAARQLYALYWQDLHPSFRWDDNPPVWVLTYRTESLANAEEKA